VYTILLAFLRRSAYAMPMVSQTLKMGWPQHLLEIASLAPGDITAILDLAEKYCTRNRAVDKKHAILKGRTLINLFYENSTRTRSSFELAGKRLGMDVININASAASVAKGETLLDTALTLNAMQADIIALRYPHAGAVQLIAEKVNASVINAGDGAHEHPTQALLDALTIRRRKGAIKGLKVAICGDIAHSRVARSNILLLTKLGAEVTVIGPPTLMPMDVAQYGISVSHKLHQGLKDADIVMMLRIQFERIGGKAIASVRDYFHAYGLTYEALSHAKPDALVLHPGPMNRGVEIDSDLADDLMRSAVLDQVEMGVAVRQAILEMLIMHKDKAKEAS
jgi:aspartate carbamoyltransferase catalytic subunit